MGRRVLLVDDEPELVQLVTMLLNRVGCEVVAASSAAEALNKLRQEEIDLVLLDIILPDADGWKVLEEIKANKRLEDIPVIVFTAKTEDERDVQFIEEYDLPVIKKPFDSRDLMERVSRHSRFGRKSRLKKLNRSSPQ